MFAFCSAEVISEMWVWTFTALIASIIAYMAVRTSTKDVDLVKYEHIPLMSRRRKIIIEWCEGFESPEVQLKRLQGAFERGTLIEIFLKKRDEEVEEGVLNYISIEDVTLTKKCNVREISEDVYYEDDYDSIENAKIVASYKCLEDLVADGWIINEEMYDY
jgi:hypothetical protein